MKHPLLISCLLFLGACGKKDSSTPAVTFNGYTGRDALNVVTSPVDATDWTLDTNWNSTEEGLFTKYNITYTQPLLAASTWQFSLYPNPVALNGYNDLEVLKDKSNTAIPRNVRLAWVLVDTKYNVLTGSDIYGVNQKFGTRVGYVKSVTSPNTLYRMYYVIFDTNTLQAYYKGHGDVQVVP